jgi:putative component of toxin-antitoxin plasmid stabilization module
MRGQKRRTISRSFRLDEQALNILEEEAEKQKTTPNALLNHILSDYCLFYRYLKHIPTITMTQELFAKIIRDCPEENVREYAKQSGSAMAKDIFGVIGLDFNRENLAFYLEEIQDRYANAFTYNHHINDCGKDVFHLRHNLGEKWSIFLSEEISTLIECCCGEQVKKELTKNTVTIEVALDKKPRI